MLHRFLQGSIVIVIDVIVLIFSRLLPIKIGSLHSFSIFSCAFKLINLTNHKIADLLSCLHYFEDYQRLVTE